MSKIMGMVKSNTIVPPGLIKHSHIQRSSLERHKEIISEIRPDFISIMLSEREERPRCVRARVHENPKHVSLSAPLGLGKSWKDNLSVSNPLTFNLLKCFGTVI